jgi:hypothetical protein
MTGRLHVACGARRLAAAIMAAAASAWGCSGAAAVNAKPLAEVIMHRLEPQSVTVGTSLLQMAMVYQTSPALIRRLNPGNPAIGEGDNIVADGTVLMPRVSCDAMVSLRKRTVTVSCGLTTVRVYPCRFGPRAARLTPGTYILERKLRIKPGAEENYLGTRLVEMGHGFIIHGGAPERGPGEVRYKDTAAGVETCLQLSNSDVEELYDLLEKSATITVDVE